MNACLLSVSFQRLKAAVVFCLGFLAEKTSRKIASPHMIGNTLAAFSMLAARICTRAFYGWIMLATHAFFHLAKRFILRVKSHDVNFECPLLTII
jgi:hypothetical protein